jgi:hypothetical protein
MQAKLSEPCPQCQGAAQEDCPQCLGVGRGVWGMQPDGTYVFVADGRIAREEA